MVPTPLNILRIYFDASSLPPLYSILKPFTVYMRLSVRYTTRDQVLVQFIKMVLNATSAFVDAYNTLALQALLGQKKTR